ncbi:protein shisa-6 isoform X2 [Ambystoma mexicanum]|uniref:protein shisa-6 isoform X2 n=1 Tax=Ambystoma mexicanum TaxID=8296 RepID=UPI0037E78F44
MRRYHLLLLVIYLDPLTLLSPSEAAARTKGAKNVGQGKRPANPPKGKDLNSTALPPVVVTRKFRPPVVVTYDKCMGYYDVSGQWDKEFDCNNTAHRYCCGTCSYRYCCDTKSKRVDQESCRGSVWIESAITKVTTVSPEGDYDPDKDKTNTTVYISCGVISFVIMAGIFAKVAYDKARRPPREMNIHRALADILRQQGPIPIAHCEREAIPAVDHSPKENTPVRTSTKNHYTPVRSSKPNHGHYGKDIYQGGGPDLHNFISSGFVTLGRGHLKGDHQQNYNHLVLNSASQTPTNGKKRTRHGSTDELSTRITEQIPRAQWQCTLPSHCSTNVSKPSSGETTFIETPRMNNILTSATEPYDLSFSRSFQNLSHLPPSYESAVKTNSTDKEADEYYMRRRHLPDLAARGTLPLNVIKMSQEQSNYRERPRRPVRAMSQDRVLSPERSRPEEFCMSYDRILSDEQLLSAERLHSQDPLLSPEKVMTLKRSDFQDKSMSRAISHTDVFVSTPTLDRYRVMTKMHSHPSASNNLYNTLGVNQTAAKRQAFASRRHNTVEQLHYIPGHHQQYRTASKTEVTV